MTAAVRLPRRRGPLRDALSVLPTSGCVLWAGNRNNRGYGMGTDRRGRPVAAHRVVYERVVGPIPVGLQLDHLCLVRECVNPAHLEPVTAAENNRRARARPRFSEGVSA